MPTDHAAAYGASPTWASPDGRWGVQYAMAKALKPDPDGARIVLMAAEIRSSVLLSVIGMAAVTIVVIFVKLTFAPLVRPPMLLNAWLTAIASVMAFWAISTSIFVRRAPD